jgi:hypothetical protein
MTDLPALLDEGTDHTATTCLACGATRAIGHLPICPANHADATDLLVETLRTDSSRTWLIAGLKHNLTPARRRRFADQIPQLHWVRPVDQPSLPFSTGALINEIVPQMGIGQHVAAIGYNPLATVPVTDCGCTDVWRCRCDFDGHRFRFADADLWPDYSVLGLKVRYQTSWSHMWLLDNGLGAIWVAEDSTTVAAATSPITRRCYLRWCDTCPGQATAAPDAQPAPCTCTCHHEGDSR